MTIKTASLAVGAMIIAAVLSFIAVRSLGGGSSASTEVGEETAGVETAEPTPAPVSPTATAEFTGKIAGITIVADENDVLPPEAGDCFRKLQAEQPKGGGQGETVGVESADVAAGTVMDISPSHLPTGFPDPKDIDPESSFFIPTWAAVCGGQIYEVVRTYHPGQAELNVLKWNGTDRYAPVPSVDPARFEVISVGGQEALHIKKAPDGLPIDQDKIIVRKPYGVLAVYGSNLPLSDLVKVAEGLN